MQKYSLRAELAAEFLGTLILILLGNGVVAMVVLFAKGTPGEVVHGGFTNITIGWGLAVTMGCYAAGRISGAHLNPAVTIAFAIFRDFSWRKVAPYILAQVAGAFLAAALVFWNYLPAFHAADPHLDHTAGIFTTFPAFPEVPSAGLLDQTIGTAILLFMVMALTDARNQRFRSAALYGGRGVQEQRPHGWEHGLLGADRRADLGRYRRRGGIRLGPAPVPAGIKIPTVARAG